MPGLSENSSIVPPSIDSLGRPAKKALEEGSLDYKVSKELVKYAAGLLRVEREQRRNNYFDIVFISDKRGTDVYVLASGDYNNGSWVALRNIAAYMKNSGIEGNVLLAKKDPKLKGSVYASTDVIWKNQYR